MSDLELVLAELREIKRMIGIEEEWPRSRVVDFLGCDNATITRWITSGTLVPTKRSTPRKQFFYSSQVKSLKKD